MSAHAEVLGSAFTLGRYEFSLWEEFDKQWLFVSSVD
jgi:hypothetical protein